MFAWPKAKIKQVRELRYSGINLLSQVELLRGCEPSFDPYYSILWEQFSNLDLNFFQGPEETRPFVR